MMTQRHFFYLTLVEIDGTLISILDGNELKSHGGDIAKINVVNSELGLSKSFLEENSDLRNSEIHIEKARAYGKALFNLVLGGRNNRHVWEHALRYIEEGHEVFLLIQALRGRSHEFLYRLLCDPHPTPNGVFLARKENLYILRQLRNCTPRNLTFRKPIRGLFAWSDPAMLRTSNEDKGFAEWIPGTKTALGRELVDENWKVDDPPTPGYSVTRGGLEASQENLEEALKSKKYHFLHLIAHLDFRS